jgi:seryl-tRNA synthetase
MATEPPVITELADPPDPLAHLSEALLHRLGVEGVYARTALYEGIIERLSGLVSRERHALAQVLRFPPVMSRQQLERSGYLKSFPNLLGCVCALHGTEPQIRAAASRHESGGDWTQALDPSDLVLTPAACYPLYPLVARRGAVPRGGLLYDVSADCFRHEPSSALDRLQSFRMREFVCIGSPAEVVEFRAEWMQRVEGLARKLELPCSVEPATDPFFGRVGLMMAITQRQQALKFELLIPYSAGATPTACMSFNCHQDHFANVWGIAGQGGAAVHTGCVAFGLDRLAVALFAHHGLELERWPGSVRHALEL